MSLFAYYLLCFVHFHGLHIPNLNQLGTGEENIRHSVSATSKTHCISNLN